MNIVEFWNGIGLGNNHREAAFGMEFAKQECERLYELYRKEHKWFFEEVLKKENSGLWFLWLYSHMACEVYDRYREKGISETIFWDTFRDIRFWCENSEKEFGTLGIREYEWFYRHMDMILFRFGRLQFEKMEMVCSVTGITTEGVAALWEAERKHTEEYGEVGSVVIHKGTQVINIHIAQGEPLIWEDCEKSLDMAKKFWGDKLPYVCHSWLLYPGLDEVLSENSNIREFRRHFKVLQVDYKEREGEWRVFGKVLKNVADYPEDTSLQRRMKEYLLEGKVLGNGWGVLEEKT